MEEAARGEEPSSSLATNGGTEIEIIPPPVSSTRDDGDFVAFDKPLEKLLEKGVRIGSAGAFHLVPYLHWFNPYGLFDRLDLEEGDIPALKLGLVHINSGFLGIKRIGSFNDLTDRSLAVLSGLKRVPDQSTCHEFLGFPRDVTDGFMSSSGRRFMGMGEIKGGVVNADKTSMEYAGEKPLTLGWHPQAGGGRPVVLAWSTQCQRMQNPIWLEASYADVDPAEMMPLLVSRTKRVLGKGSLYVEDRQFHVYDLFRGLDAAGVGFLTLARYIPKKIIEGLRDEDFEQVGNNLEVATAWFDLWDKVRMPDSPVLKLIGVRYSTGKRVGYLTNDYHTPEPLLVYYYKTCRQYIDNMFRDSKGFFGLDCLPSLGLGKIRALVAHKMVSNNLMSSFKHEIGGRFYNMTPQRLSKKILQVPGFVKLDGSGTIVVKLDRFREQEYVRPLFDDLSEKMVEFGLSPNIPYLNNHPLEIRYS